MAVLPYLSAPGNIEKALGGIKSAATPERVSQDFVKTILKIRGGSGNQVTSFLKKIGFVNADGSPSKLYKMFRNHATSGKAVAEALRTGYAALYVRNEYMHQMTDNELRGLIIEETGQEQDSSVIALTLACIKALKKSADWSTGEPTEKTDVHQTTGLIIGEDNNQSDHTGEYDQLGLNLSYTINLNLPATSDISVFNAIFKSLRENLLRSRNVNS